MDSGLLTTLVIALVTIVLVPVLLGVVCVHAAGRCRG